MAGMDMTMDMSMSMSGQGPIADSEQMPAGHQGPCGQPTAPSDCQVLAACATGLFASAVADLELGDRIISGRVTRPQLSLSSRSIPPEPPPPRA